MSKMNRMAKFGLVLGGYVVACLVAVGAVYVNQFFTQDASQASAGMAAFGDLILFVGLFGFLALFPTGLALYFLIRNLLKRKA